MVLTLKAARSNEIRGMHWDAIHLFEKQKAAKRGF